MFDFVTLVMSTAIVTNTIPNVCFLLLIFLGGGRVFPWRRPTENRTWCLPAPDNNRTLSPSFLHTTVQTCRVAWSTNRTDHSLLLTYMLFRWLKTFLWMLLAKVCDQIYTGIPIIAHCYRLLKRKWIIMVHEYILTIWSTSVWYPANFFHKITLYPAVTTEDNTLWVPWKQHVKDFLVIIK